MKKTIVLWMAIVCSIATICIFYIQNSESTLREEEQQQIVAAVRKAAVQCYALEGKYPKDIEYLKEHYQLTIETSSYKVYYTNNGDNLMPNIDVIRKK